MIYQKTVSSFMKKDVITLQATDTAEAAASLMVAHKIGCVIVQDVNKKPIGIVTEKDLVDKVIALAEGPAVKLEKIMTSPLITVKNNSRISKVVKIMTENEIKRIPVTNKRGELIGILTISDILKEMLKTSLEEENALEYLKTALSIVHKSLPSES